MKRWARRIALALVVLALLALGGAWYGQSALGPALRDRLVRDLPGQLGIEVEIADIDLNLLGGRAEVRGVRLGNPEGFVSPDLFRSASFSVSYSPLGFLNGHPRVEEVALRGPELTWETRGGLDTNWKAVLGRTGDKPRPAEAPRAPAPSPRPPAERPEGGGLLIERIRVEQAVLRVVGTHSASNGPPVRLPTFDIVRPGRADGDSGLTILFKVMGALAVGMQQAASNAPPAAVALP